jgi:hypothetical protein
MLRRADGALYAAKCRGRDRVVDHADRERAVRERDGDLELDSFEEMTRVLADRVAGPRRDRCANPRRAARKRLGCALRRRGDP